MEIDNLENWKKQNVPIARIEHMQRTADLAATLAKKHHLNEEKAYLAGLAHDIAKDKNISIIPFAFQDFLEQEGLMQQDGIHPSAEAQPRLAEVVWQHLSRHLQ